MRADSELQFERSALAKANVDIERGEERVVRQQGLISGLQARGQETKEAERLLDLLQQTLGHWHDHRQLILKRILYLEAKTGSTGGAPQPLLGGEKGE